MIIWKCSIIDRDLDRDATPAGADLPMREAVREAFRTVIGRNPEGMFSGFGYQHITEPEAAVLDGRTPNTGYELVRDLMADLLRALSVPRGDDFTVERELYDIALNALTEAVYATKKSGPGPQIGGEA